MSGRRDGAETGPGEVGPWREALARLWRNRMARVGLLTLALVVFGCFALPELLGLDPATTDPVVRHRPPSPEHWFGTDSLGRDFLARVLIGGRTSLLIGLAATSVAVLVGVGYGAAAGYYGGRADEVMMRLVDFLYGLPYMFLVILIMLLFSETARGDALPVFLALGFVEWLTMARIVRGQVLGLRTQEFVLAAQLMGAGDGRILLRHILPNVTAVVIVYATLTVPSVIILESFLSFLGLGVELSWGQLVAEGVEVVNPIHSYWWLLLFPSAMLGVTLFSLNFIGDGLRDVVDAGGGS